jgi:3-hydroxybutyryl-CoA dehydrogenase
MTNEAMKIGIIGEGKMGTNLFQYLSEFDLNIKWVCSPGADIGKLQRSFSRKMSRSLENGLIDREGFERIGNNMTITSDIALLGDCNLVIESITEDARLKRRLFKAIDPIVPVDSILASNSSSIHPSEMLPSCIRKRSFIGLHFFYPVSLKNIVEIISMEWTSWQTREAIEKFLNLINRRFIHLGEKDSFILNRIFLDIQNEAYLLVRDGKATYRQIDTLVKEHFFPNGVFEFMDSVGLDIMLTSVMHYILDYPHKDYYLPLATELETLVSGGKLGQKTQEGFFSYPINGDIPEPPADPDEIIRRLSFAYISAFKRFGMQAKCDLADLNDAVREYFGTDKGPLDPVP